MNDTWIDLTVVLGTIAVVSWLKQSNHPWIKLFLDWFPAILFAYIIPALFTHTTGLDLSEGRIHQLSKNWVLPLTVLSVMSALSFKELKIVGIRPILLFVSGSIVIATLPVLLVVIFGQFSESSQELFLNQAYWKGLVPIVGGWIGGSTSQLVLKELAETSESLFLSVLVLDNILVNIWTLLMFQFIKKSKQLNLAWNIPDEIPIHVSDEKNLKTTGLYRTILTFSTLSIILLITFWMQLSFIFNILLLSFVGLILGNTVRSWNHKGVLKLSGFLILLIMAILGLRLNFSNLTLPFSFVSLVVIWLIAHFVFMLILARWMKLNVAWVAIGSMANLGGISTAPAVTSAYKKELMPHAILLAILSMVTGTSWGMLTIYLFQLLS